MLPTDFPIGLDQVSMGKQAAVTGQSFLCKVVPVALVFVAMSEVSSMTKS